MIRMLRNVAASGLNSLANSLKNNNSSNPNKKVKPSTSIVKKAKPSEEKAKSQKIKTKPTPRNNFIAIGGEANRGTVSTKPEKGGHPLYTKKVTEQEKKEFRTAYNTIKNEHKKPVNSNYTYYGSQAKKSVGARKTHRDGSVSVKNEDGSITRTSKAGEKMSHTDSKGDTRYYVHGQEVKTGYVTPSKNKDRIKAKQDALAKTYLEENKKIKGKRNG